MNEREQYEAYFAAHDARCKIIYWLLVVAAVCAVIAFNCDFM